MKRITFILTLILSFVLSACNTSENGSAGNSLNSESSDSSVVSNQDQTGSTDDVSDAANESELNDRNGSSVDSMTVESPLSLSDNIIRITSGENTAEFQLYDTVAAKELYEQLPLDLELSNFRNAQWMFYPPERLNVTSSEAYHDGKKGELSYYEPWGDVFMLYEDFYAGDEMHRLGICLTGIDNIEKMTGNITVEKRSSDTENKEHKAKLIIDGKELSVTLFDSPAANDLYSILPLELTFEDYNGIEKIGYLPRELNTDGEPNEFDPTIGDLALYKPWGNISIFYNEFGLSNGLISLGKIDSDIEVLATRDGNFTALLTKY